MARPQQDVDIQKLFKLTGGLVTANDFHGLTNKRNSAINSAIKNNLDYICAEILATSIELVDNVGSMNDSEIELDEGIKTLIAITKFN